MDKRRINKLLVLAGSFLVSNGALLLLTPGRYAVLRKLGWMPEQYNATIIERLGTHRTQGRVVGLVVLALGLALVATGLSRTEPAS